MVFAMQSKFELFVKKIIVRTIEYIFSFVNGIVIYYKGDEIKDLKMIQKIKKESDMLFMDAEAYQILTVVRNTRKIKGDIAEIGVYRGGSSKIICKAKQNKHLYLFDTFEGLPEPDKTDSAHFHKGNFTSRYEEVKNYLKAYKDVHIYKGLFPDTAGPIKNKSFSFVHIDVDIYKSTLDCLKFFYPRVNRGGVILLHDYTISKGLKKAVDEFFKNKREPVVEIPAGTQCIIVKL